MTEDEIKFIAAQLRQPAGEAAVNIGEKMNEGNRLMNLATIDMLQLESGERLLEIGMGNGFFVKNLFDIENTIHYEGCDFSDAMVQEANKLNKTLIEKGLVRFRVATADQLPFQDNTFDKIFSVNTIYFWDDVPAVFTEFSRVLKEDGQLVLAIRPKSIMDNFPVTQYGFTTFSLTDLSDILHENGFDPVVAIERQEPDLEFFGEKLKNEFLIVKAIKNRP
ncbi:MAG: class I SAM-dependent methyltransferase [Bacteroidetes bacterium]|nr:class I SAM-dependent methyltransferase [Bacteroidota bacterium]